MAPTRAGNALGTAAVARVVVDVMLKPEISTPRVRRSRRAARLGVGDVAQRPASASGSRSSSTATPDLGRAEADRRQAARQPGHRGLRAAPRRPTETDAPLAHRCRHLPGLAGRRRRRPGRARSPAASRSRSGTPTPTCKASTPSSCPAASPTATTCAPAPSPGSRAVMETIVEPARDGLPVLGICNGFQVLCEAAPAARRAHPQQHLHFRNRDQGLRVERADTAWTDGYQPGPGDRRSRSRTARAATSPTTATLDGWRARAGSSPATSAATRTARSATSPAITNEAGNVVGIMPHPEHAVEALTGPSTDGLGFFTSRARQAVVQRVTRRHRRARREDARTTSSPTPSSASKPTSTSGSARSSAAGRPRPSWRCTRSCGASTAPTSRARCTCASSARRPRPATRCSPASARTPASSTSPTARGDLQGRVAQPPELRRALPGRGHRRRRHRPRHPRDGRPPGRRDGPAALRRAPTTRTPPGCCPASSPASAATATAWACPTSAARSSSTPATRATRWSTRCASACMRQRTAAGQGRTGPGNMVVLLGAKTGRDGIGGVSVLASATFDEREPGKRPVGAGRRPVHREAAHRGVPGAVRRRPGRRHPGPRRRRPDLRAHRDCAGAGTRHARRPGPGAAARGVDGRRTRSW